MESFKKQQLEGNDFLATLENDEWCSIAELISHKVVEVSMIASSIELAPCYSVDEFHRIALDKDRNALEPLRKYASIEPGMDRDDREKEYYLAEWDSPLFRYGWIRADLPDFEAQYKRWIQIQGAGALMIDVSSGDGSRLLLALVQLILGKEAVIDLGKPNSKTVRKLQEKLDLNGDKFNKDTLRKYLKDRNPKLEWYIERLKHMD